MKSKKKIFFISALFLTLFMVNFNPSYGKGKEKVGSNRNFLSEVRYIITKDEAKFFRRLPDEKKEEFIEQFWKIRDPNIQTEENEFKDEYFLRIDEANQQFTAGIEGWRTDRGKTHILLGPPVYKSRYPVGGYRFSRPFEIWHYSEAFIIFVDNKGFGDYQVQYVSLTHQAMVHDAFLKAKNQNEFLKDLFNYDFKSKKINKIPHLVFTFDLDKIIFKEEGDRMVTNFEIFVNIKDRDYNNIWNYQKIHRADFLKSQTGKKLPNKIKIEIPLKIKRGKYFFFTSVKKMDDNKKVFQNKILKIK